MTADIQHAAAVPAPSKHAIGMKHRLDIQGLRAVAVGLVVAYHADLPGISGGFIGVDLFFVLSGYLIIGLMAAELARTGTVRLGQFWARRARRLVPASALVLVATVIAARHLLPFFERKAVGDDAMWAALFSANWRFAQQETDYLAADRSPSPILHFWSLGVEEQFYIVTPLLFVAIALFARARNRRTDSRRRVQIDPIRLVTVMLIAIVVVSLVYCIRATETNQPYAFFGTPARAWQLGVGGLLAVAVPLLPEMGKRLGTLLSLIGLALLGACTVLLQEGGETFGTAYPSWLAIGPTLAGVLLIAGGFGGGPISWLFSTRPFTFVGDISYSLYLWHWPLLVLGPIYFDDDRLFTRLTCVATAFTLAVLTYLLIEDPIRKAKVLSRTLKPIVSVAIGAVFVAGAFAVAQDLSSQTFADVSAAAGKANPKDSIVGVTPAVDKAPLDEGPLRSAGCQVGRGDTPVPDREDCIFGDPDGDRSVVLLGDSIAGAVFPPLEKAAKEKGWVLTAWAKAACTLGDFDVFRQKTTIPWPDCATWRASALEKTLALKPDAVVMANSGNSHNRINLGDVKTDDAGRTRIIEEGLERTIKRFTDAGIKVILVESPYRSPFNVPECLIEKLSISGCTFEHKSEDEYSDAIAKRHDDVFYVQGNDRMCNAKTCKPVVDGMVTLRDFLHFTQTFANVILTPQFEKALDAS